MLKTVGDDKPEVVIIIVSRGHVESVTVISLIVRLN
jgi:hypothetical protein